MPRQQGDANSSIPAAAARCKKETLDLLNAKYDRHDITPFEFEGLVLPDELQKGTTRSINNAKYSHRPGSRGSSQYQQLLYNNLRLRARGIRGLFHISIR